MRVVDLMIIGAQKAGTTSLKNYLAEHPSITSHPQIEFTYFQDEEEYKKGFDYCIKNYFDSDPNKKIVAKNAAMHFKNHGIDRVKDHNPNATIVFIVRNPVDRAYSAYWMGKRGGWIDQPLSDLEGELAKKHGHLYYWMIKLGFYHQQLLYINKHFNKSQVLVIPFRDLKENPSQVCQSIFKRLDIDDTFEPNINKVHNKGNKIKSKNFNSILNTLRHPNNPLKKAVKSILPYKTFLNVANSIEDLNRSTEKETKMSAELRQLLIDFYKPYNQQLEDYLGMDFSHWQE